MRKRGARGTITAMGPREIYDSIGPAMFRSAYEQGMSLSAYLEHLNPSTSDDKRSGFDAFSRVLKEADIVTRSIPEAGLYADVWEDVFDKTPQDRVLGLEWAARQWRRAQAPMLAGSGSREIFMSDDYAVGTAMRPYVDNANIRLQTLSAAIPLSRLVAITTPISGSTYRAIYLVDTAVDADAKRFVRVGETGEIPGVKLQEASRTINIYKFGRKLTSSYEVLRRQRIDRVALQIALMAIQAEKDKVAVALDTLVSGDGNASTAATNSNLTTLDATATAGTLTIEGYLAWKVLFEQPYAMTVILAKSDVAVQAMLMNMGTANVPMTMVAPQIGIGGFTPINPGLGDNVALGWLSDAPTGKLVGIDTRVALERVTEIGSDITEVERRASNQTQELIMTEVEGYAVIDPRATRTLDINA